MRGYPPIEALIALVVLLLMAIPLQRLTTARPAPEVASEVVTQEVGTAPMLEVTFTAAPRKLSLGWAGVENAEMLPGAANGTRLYRLPLDAQQGIDIVMRGEWSAGPVACRLRMLSAEGDVLAEQTIWVGAGTFDGVVSLP